jgi:hypothetical protein
MNNPRKYVPKVTIKHLNQKQIKGLPFTKFSLSHSMDVNIIKLGGRSVD